MRACVQPSLRASVLAVLGAVVACNGVLGIERAELDENATGNFGTCERPVNSDPDLECIPSTSTCEECLAECSPSLVTECLGEERCRAALVDYRLCIWDDCTDENGSCGGCFGGSALATRLGQCLRGCSNKCAESAVASLCEAYCSCMSQNCTNDYADETCEADCELRPTWKTHCWWEHCERALSASSQHCSHATIREDACPRKRGVDETCDPPLRWDRSPCLNGEECCSGVCSDAEICVPD